MDIKLRDHTVILLAEDSEEEASIFIKFLTETPFHGILVRAKDGEEVLDFVLQRGEYKGSALPNIIFLDLSLPKISGKEILIELSKLGIKIPVIVLSGSLSDDDVRECMSLGAASFFSKPSDINQMRWLVTHLKDIEIPRLITDEVE